MCTVVPPDAVRDALLRPQQGQGALVPPSFSKFLFSGLSSAGMPRLDRCLCEDRPERYLQLTQARCFLQLTQARCFLQLTLARCLCEDTARIDMTKATCVSLLASVS